MLEVIGLNLSFGGKRAYFSFGPLDALQFAPSEERLSLSPHVILLLLANQLKPLLLLLTELVDDLGSSHHLWRGVLIKRLDRHAVLAGTLADEICVLGAECIGKMQALVDCSGRLLVVEWLVIIELPRHDLRLSFWHLVCKTGQLRARWVRLWLVSVSRCLDVWLRLARAG